MKKISILLFMILMGSCSLDFLQTEINHDVVYAVMSENYFETAKIKYVDETVIYRVILEDVKLPWMVSMHVTEKVYLSLFVSMDNPASICWAEIYVDGRMVARNIGQGTVQVIYNIRD